MTKYIEIGYRYFSCPRFNYVIVYLFLFFFFHSTITTNCIVQLAM